MQLLGKRDTYWTTFFNKRGCTDRVQELAPLLIHVGTDVNDASDRLYEELAHTDYTPADADRAVVEAIRTRITEQLGAIFCPYPLDCTEEERVAISEWLRRKAVDTHPSYPPWLTEQGMLKPRETGDSRQLPEHAPLPRTPMGLLE